MFFRLNCILCWFLFRYLLVCAICELSILEELDWEFYLPVIFNILGHILFIIFSISIIPLVQLQRHDWSTTTAKPHYYSTLWSRLLSFLQVLYNSNNFFSLKYLFFNIFLHIHCSYAHIHLFIIILFFFNEKTFFF